MSRTYKTVMREVSEVDTAHCNKCGTSVGDAGSIFWGPFEVTFMGLTGGHRFDLCGACASEFMASFKLPADDVEAD